MLDDKRIKELAVSSFPRDAVENMIKEANKKGGRDNISVQVIHTDINEELYKTDWLKKKRSKKKFYFYSLFVIIFLILVLFLIIHLT